jgi:hypothetical protein
VQVPGWTWGKSYSYHSHRFLCDTDYTHILHDFFNLFRGFENRQGLGLYFAEKTKEIIETSLGLKNTALGLLWNLTWVSKPSVHCLIPRFLPLQVCSMAGFLVVAFLGFRQLV